MLVFGTDLDETDEAKLTDYPHPYAMALGLPRPKIGSWLNGEAKRRAVIDVVLEYRAVDGKRPSRRPLTELAYQIARLARPIDPYITELDYQVPLLKPLEWLTSTPIDSKPDDTNTLTCTVRFVANYRTLF